MSAASRAAVKLGSATSFVPEPVRPLIPALFVVMTSLPSKEA
jgi:hypothetical protein